MKIFLQFVVLALMVASFGHPYFLAITFSQTAGDQSLVGDQISRPFNLEMIIFAHGFGHQTPVSVISIALGWLDRNSLVLIKVTILVFALEQLLRAILTISAITGRTGRRT